MCPAPQISWKQPALLEGLYSTCIILCIKHKSDEHPVKQSHSKPFRKYCNSVPRHKCKNKKTIAQANVNVSYIHTLLPSLSCFLKEQIAQCAISIASSNTPSPYTILIFPPVFYDHITNLYSHCNSFHV